MSPQGLQAEIERAIQFLRDKNASESTIKSFDEFLAYNAQVALESFKETYPQFAALEQGQRYDATAMLQTQPLDPVQAFTEKVKMLDGMIDFYSKPGGDQRSLNSISEQRDDLFKEAFKDASLMENIKEQKADIYERIQQQETQFRGMAL